MSLDFYLQKLSSIQAEEVTVKLEDIENIIGVDLTEELCLSKVNMVEKLIVKKKSAIPANKRIKETKLVNFNRIVLVKALQNAKNNIEQRRISDSDNDLGSIESIQGSF